jgi:preprotein translocase SecF subunit
VPSNQNQTNSNKTKEKTYPFDFVKHRKKAFTFSIVITLLGIIVLLFSGLNYGVDFRAGTSLDIDLHKSGDLTQIDKVFADVGLIPDSRNLGGTEDNRITARFKDDLTEAQTASIINGLKTVYGDQISYEENTVDPGIALEMRNKAIMGVLVASIGIIIYTAIRFEWRFGLAAIIALFHDAFFVVTIFSVFHLEVNLPFVAAILTIIGYSINDTIVIFDRIRENLRFAKIKTFDDLSRLVNTSIWQTMSRSINTGLTVLIAAAFLLIFGSESIRLFSLAMTVGLVIGVYSTVFIASQIWLILKYRSMQKKPAAQQPASAS